MADSITIAFRRGVLEHILASRPKIALYSKAAQLSEKTGMYTPEAEVRGDGYSAGGVFLSGGKIVESGGNLSLEFDNPVWHNATITARWGLIYLADSAGRSVRTIDFTKDITSTNGPFTVILLPATESGVITI